MVSSTDPRVQTIPRVGTLQQCVMSNAIFVQRHSLVKLMGLQATTAEQSVTPATQVNPYTAQQGPMWQHKGVQGVF